MKIPIQYEDNLDLFEINEINGTPPKERLAISREAFLLLGSIQQCPPECLGDEERPNPHRVRDMKVELPLLRTEHDMDMMSLCRRIEPNVVIGNLLPAMVEDEKDEGLHWSSRHQELPVTVTRGLESEKFSITTEALIYLQDIGRPPAKDQKPPFDDDNNRRRSKMVCRTTCTLLDIPLTVS
jgi:hypothetical protein